MSAPLTWAGIAWRAIIRAFLAASGMKRPRLYARHHVLGVSRDKGRCSELVGKALRSTYYVVEEAGNRHVAGPLTPRAQTPTRQRRVQKMASALTALMRNDTRLRDWQPRALP